MECRADQIDPTMGQPVDCRCERCVDRADELRTLEVAIARYVGALLAADWRPVEIVDVVRRTSRRGSNAAALVRVELACLAGYWIGRPDRADWLGDAEIAVRGTGFGVGTTLPGWLAKWADRRAYGDLARVRRTVGELIDVLDPIVAVAASAPLPPEVSGRIAILHRRSARRTQRRADDPDRPADGGGPGDVSDLAASADRNCVVPRSIAA